MTVTARRAMLHTSKGIGLEFRRGESSLLFRATTVAQFLPPGNRRHAAFFLLVSQQRVSLRPRVFALGRMSTSLRTERQRAAARCVAAAENVPRCRSEVRPLDARTARAAAPPV